MIRIANYEIILINLIWLGMKQSNDTNNGSSYYINLLPQYQDLIVRYIYKILHKYECYDNIELDIDDLRQMVNLKLLSAIENYRGDCSLSSYIYTVVRSVVVDEIEKYGRKKGDTIKSLDEEVEEEIILKDMIADDTRPNPEEEILNKEKDELLFKAIQQLKPMQKVVIQMTISGLTQQQIAQKLCIKQGTVSEHLNNAKKALRDALKSYYQ